MLALLIVPVNEQLAVLIALVNEQDATDS